MHIIHLSRQCLIPKHTQMGLGTGLILTCLTNHASLSPFAIWMGLHRQQLWWPFYLVLLVVSLRLEPRLCTSANTSRAVTWGASESTSRWRKPGVAVAAGSRKLPSHTPRRKLDWGTKSSNKWLISCGWFHIVFTCYERWKGEEKLWK